MSKPFSTIPNKSENLSSISFVQYAAIGMLIESNCIIFLDTSGEEVLKLKHNTGDIFVKGNLIENDKEVVDALREFLKIKNA